MSWTFLPSLFFLPYCHVLLLNLMKVECCHGAFWQIHSNGSHDGQPVISEHSPSVLGGSTERRWSAEWSSFMKRLQRRCTLMRWCSRNNGPCVCLLLHVDSVSLLVSGYLATDSDSNGIYEGGSLWTESENIQFFFLSLSNHWNCLKMSMTTNEFFVLQS